MEDTTEEVWKREKRRRTNVKDVGKKGGETLLSLTVIFCSNSFIKSTK